MSKMPGAPRRAPGPSRLSGLREEDLLGDRVPAERRRGEPLEQPPPLAVAQQGAAWVSRCLHQARLVVAVLARVEHTELRQVAVGDLSIEPHVGTPGDRRAAQRHVLVVGAVGRRPAPQERLRRRPLRGGLGGVVVLDLVIVPGDDPGEGGVGGAQVRVAAVEGVAVAIAGQARRLARVVAADVAAGSDVLVRPILVDVVAEVDDEVEVLGGHVPVRRAPPLLVVLAGGVREGELSHRPRSGTVAVLPTGLVFRPALKR